MTSSTFFRPVTPAPISSPVIADVIEALGDAAGETERQLLQPLVARVVGTTADPVQERTRCWMLADWHLRTCPMTWLSAANCAIESDALQDMGPVTDRATLLALVDPLRAASEVALTRQVAATQRAIEDAWAAAVAAAGANPADPGIVEGRLATLASATAPEIMANSDAVPQRMRWGPETTSAWGSAWEAAWVAAADTEGTAPVAAVRAHSSSSAWDGSWTGVGVEDPELFDAAREAARAVVRNAALAIGWSAGWAAAHAAASAPGPVGRSWSAAAVAASTAVRPVAEHLRDGVIELLWLMADLEGTAGVPEGEDAEG